MALITTLIDRQMNFRVIGDQIAAILAVESAGQQALATLAGEDPRNWKLRVFSRRSNPWSAFVDAPNPNTVDTSPIVNVALDNKRPDKRASNVVERQKVVATYNIDCLGYGLSADDGATGHRPGDETATEQAENALALVESILMSGHYTYLGMQGVVWGRWR